MSRRMRKRLCWFTVLRNNFPEASADEPKQSDANTDEAAYSEIMDTPNVVLVDVTQKDDDDTSESGHYYSPLDGPRVTGETLVTSGVRPDAASVPKKLDVAYPVQAQNMNRSLNQTTGLVHRRPPSSSSTLQFKRGQPSDTESDVDVTSESEHLYEPLQGRYGDRSDYTRLVFRELLCRFGWQP
nr:hypothetical protein BaRGS_005951 [Batillaria attramentaria]